MDKTLSMGHFRIVQERKNKVEVARRNLYFFFFFVQRKLQTIPLNLVSVILFIHSSKVVYGFIVSVRYGCTWEFAKRSRS